MLADVGCSISVLYVLSAALAALPAGGKCRHPGCGELPDRYGMHARQCKKGGAIQRCHNAMRDELRKIAEEASGHGVTYEQQIPFGPEGFEGAPTKDVLDLN